jgi:hypothetical protein
MTFLSLRYFPAGEIKTLVIASSAQRRGEVATILPIGRNLLHFRLVPGWAASCTKLWSTKKACLNRREANGSTKVELSELPKAP